MMMLEDGRAVQIPTSTIVDEALYDPFEAGAILRKHPSTLRNSRHTGKLAGVAAPAHLKIGTRAYYRGRTLREWLGQFQEQVKAGGAA